MGDERERGVADDDDRDARGDEAAARPGDEHAADERLIGILESVLFAAGEPIPLGRLGDIIAGPSRAELRAALAELGRRAESDRRGVRLVEVGGGYQFRTAPEHAEWVRRLFQQKPWRLTRATLETLAIIAYKQPITRAEIEAIRGVDVDSVLASLLSRKLVKILGRKDVIGRPLLYGTTRQFLEVFGLKDLASLPAVSEVVPALHDGVAAGAASAAEDDTWSGDETGNEADGSPAAEAPGAGGDLLATSGGDADPPGQGSAERADDHGAGDPRSTR
jgi:segregation and condensation protein B